MSLLDHLRAVFERLVNELDDAAKDVEVEVMEAVRDGLGGVRETVAEFVADLKAYGAAHPEPIFAILRRIQPILLFKNYALVTRFEDVEEVLARDDVFDVPYAERMRLITDGENFFLGMRDSPRYSQDRSIMRLVARREDVESVIRPLVAGVAESIVAAAPGRLDFVTELSRVVPARFVGEYFGTPGPSTAEMYDWTSTLFWFLFFDQENDVALRKRALAASAALNGSIDASVAERKQKPGAEHDVLARCLRLQAAGLPGVRDLDIRNNFIGLIIGAIPTTSTVAALALDELLRRPDELAGAQAAARANSDALLLGYVLEALRFNPMTPGIFRVSNQEFALAKGELRETTIPAGATVIVSTQSAMFDRLRIDDADSFRIDRAPRDYLHWGSGLHTCFGQHVNQVQIPEILKPLLRRKGLRRAEGEAGELKKDGPFAASLGVEFD